jgi:N-acetylglutamate synthase-like GNAT family acetyltransferase
MEKLVFVVRKAEYEDIPQIKEAAREAFRLYAEGAGILEIVGTLEETYEDLEKEIDNKLVLVAEADGKVVGSVRIEIKADKTAYLSRFGVLGSYQSHGIGRQLIKAVDIEMIKLGVTNLYLNTASRMFSLVRFYYGLGFYIESTTKDQGYIRALLCKEYENGITNKLVI